MKQKWIPVPPPGRVYKKENLTEILKVSQFIYQIGESKDLRRKNNEVKVEDILTDKMQHKIAYLKKCFKNYKRITNGKGRGIAAVQVGIPERFFLLYKETAKEKYQIFINPIITKTADIFYRYSEACMSANSLVASVIRPAWVEVSYFDEHAQKKHWTVKANSKQGKIENRVIQHEIDHLDGVINIDHVESKELIFESGESDNRNTFFEEVK